MIVQTHLSSAQADSTERPINKKRLTFAAGATGVAFTGSMIALDRVWYRNFDRQPFQFFNDAAEWKQMDKFGHIYSAFQIAYAGGRVLQWCDVPLNKATIWASVASFAMISSIEYFDGRSAAYGASLSDVAANAMGSLLYAGQIARWKEVRIYPKFSFQRSGLAPLRPEVLGNGLSEEWLKDYNGQTYWLSLDADKFFAFPDWLNICVGIGAQNMLYARDEQNLAVGRTPYRQFYIGVDLDLTFVRSRSKVVNTLLYIANMIRLPAPAFELSKNGVIFKPFLF